MKNPTRAITLFAIAAWPVVATAAPLDEFLTALPGHAPGHGEVEVGYDVANSTVDLFNMRGGRVDARGESIGDYSGAHIRGGLALTERLHADAALWKRSLKTPFDEGESIAWQGALQYQATVNLDWLPAIALRLSGWGDSTDQVLKGSETNLFNQNKHLLNTRSMRVTDPQDQQFQGDIIGSWTVAENTLVSLFLGMGKSKVTFGGAFAVLAASPACEYQISAVSGEVNLDAVGGQCLITHTSQNIGIPIPDGMYIRYDASYVQFGGNLQWFNDTWKTRIGYRFQKWDRGSLDDAVRLYQHTPDKTAYDTNHHLTAEVNYKILDKTGVFIRGQLLQHQFVGEVPFSYNLFSSHKFADRYGFLTFGVVRAF